MATDLAVPLSRPRARPAAGSLILPALCAITALGFALRFANFADVPGNPFYDAAVRSMGESWHNFFYGAFEPGGQVSVDKTPVDLWLQVASTKLFGFNATAVRLPEALGGALAVPLLYDLVRRLFGRGAGLGAAAALAVLPIAVLTSHSDTMDSLMMVLDVAAAWLVVVGAQRRSAWLIVAAGAVLGLAFNVKLFEALFVLPALALLAWLVSDLPRRRRALALGGSLAAFVVVSLSWITAASLGVAGSRPWPIGSTNGSVWNVVFAYNGIDRLSATATKAALALDPPGPLRLFATDGRHYAALVGSTLLAALVLGGLALLVARRGPRERSAVAGTAFFATWLLVGVALISHMQRLQPRYLEAVTPAIAGVVGIGLASLAVRAPRLLAAGSAVVAVVAVALVHPPATATVLALAAAGLAVVVALVRRPARIALGACALVAVLAVPTASAISVARAHQSDAGLQVRIPGLDALSAFLIAHQGTARYEAASTSTFSASPLIVRDGRPVLMLTSYHGRPLLQAAQLARLVRDGEVRYLLVGGGGGSGVVRWARSHARAVTVPGVPKGTVFRLTSAG